MPLLSDEMAPRGISEDRPWPKSRGGLITNPKRQPQTKGKAMHLRRTVNQSIRLLLCPLENCRWLIMETIRKKSGIMTEYSLSDEWRCMSGWLGLKFYRPHPCPWSNTFMPQQLKALLYDIKISLIWTSYTCFQLHCLTLRWHQICVIILNLVLALGWTKPFNFSVELFTM